MSLYEIYNALSRLKDTPDIKFKGDMSEKDGAFLHEAISLLEQYAEFAPSIGYDYKQNVWFGCVLQDLSYQGKTQLKDDLQDILPLCERAENLKTQMQMRYLIKCADFNKMRFWREFFDFAVNFKPNLFMINGKESYEKLTSDFKNVFVRIFSPKYKRFFRLLKDNKKDAKNFSYADAVALCEKVKFFQASCDDFEIFAQNVKDKDEFDEKITQELRFILDTQNETLRRFAGVFDTKIFDIFSVDFAKLKAKCENILQEFDKLEHYHHFRALLFKLDENKLVDFVDVAIKANLAPQLFAKAFEKMFFTQWVHKITSQSPALSAFNRISYDKAVSEFCQKDKQHFEINQIKIHTKLSAKRPSVDYITNDSQLILLLREIEKKRKQKPIRTLFADAGELIMNLKPCVLMSPLSVSTFLDANVRFDAVIFDEASQIFPQDAINSIYRAKQCIIVGDSKQMPPSNFFNATIDDENDDESEDIKDFESILDLCATSFTQLRLKWHYRSRFEQLIAFSNKNFYDNTLITFPSPSADENGVGVDFHFVDGTFDRKSKSNAKEAKYIVDLIYKHIEMYPKRSLGVVAFSISQQNLIENLFSKRRQSTLEKEFFFDEGKKEPFFIKNLETVQGDERDSIIFSVAYGFDEGGRFLQNFGPLNRTGGERRLNVAVTRAKYNVLLVSSIHYTDIDLTRTNSLGVRLLREYLDYAQMVS